MKLNFKLLSVAAAAVIVASFAGCESTSTSSSNTSGVATHISNPMGTVTGTVQDTNGNPIAEVSVYLAGQTAITDAGGVYKFSNVPVTQVNQTSGNAQGQVVSVTILAPSGYLGATVTVKPAAQIDSSANTENGVETFIDGFLASAGTAVLPQTNASVTGVLMDSATEEPLANKTLTFEFLKGGTNGTTSQEQPQDGVKTTYAVKSYTIDTDDKGVFTYASLPSDSEFKILVAGYKGVNIDAGSTDKFYSDDEITITLGAVLATEVTVVDDVAPYVVSVDNVLDKTATRGMLDDDTTDTFVVHFSETLDDNKFDTAGNSIYLYAGKPGLLKAIDFTATMSTDKKSITVTTTTVLDEGDHVDIVMLNPDVTDTSANNLITGSEIGYDAVKNSAHTVVQLEIFTNANTAAPIVTTTAQMIKDGVVLAERDDTEIQASSDAFADVLSLNPMFQQLNSADDDDNNNVSDAQERLNALVIALGGQGVKADATRISFTPSGAASYLISVEDTLGTAKTQADILTGINTTSSNVNTVDSSDFGGTATALLVLNDNSDVEIFLDNVAPTDRVVITPLDTFGYMGTPTPIDLVDNVPPRTILQASYNPNNTAGHNGKNDIYLHGDGGELTGNGGAATIGIPYLAITNSLLDNQDANGETSANGATPDKMLKTELYDLSVINDDTAKPYIDGESAYDATAFTTMNGTLSRTVGVAFSEDVDLNGVIPSFTGTTGRLTGFTVKNDVMQTVYGHSRSSDLIDMQVDDILLFANIDGQNNEIIDYDGIKDTNGVTATAATNAKVVIKDEMAPMVVKAEYIDGLVEITFNENIKLYHTAVAADNIPVTTISIGTSIATYTEQAGIDGLWLGDGSNVIKISYSEFVGGINSELFWDGPEYNEAAYQNATSATDLRKHKIFNIENVTDMYSNSWTSYVANTAPTANNIEIPKFAGIFNITNWSPTIAGSDFDGANSNTVAKSVTFEFQHALRISDTVDSANMFSKLDWDADNNQYEFNDIARLNVWFGSSIDDGTTMVNLVDAGTSVSATLDKDQKKLTINFKTTAPATTGNKNILSIKDMISDFDIEQKINAKSIFADGIN